jgi:hypothetical protein
VAYIPPNPNGSATSANSAPVVVASDQAAITTDTENLVVKDDFSGSTLNASNWTVTQKSGSTQTYSVASSLLTINAAVAANDWLTFTSVKTFTIPFRVQFIVSASQRIANNNLYLEIVNASGTSSTASATTAVTTGTTQVAYVLEGATVTSSNIVAQNQGVKSTVDTTVTTATTTTAYPVFEIDAYIDSVTYATRTTEAAAATSANSTSRERTVLDPGEAYYVQIRSLNSASVPATNTAFTIEAVVIQDTTDSVVAISGGRGNADISRGIPVSTVSSITTLPTLSNVTTVSTVSSTTQSGVAIPVESNPIASAAITSTTTTVLAPTNGAAVIFQLNVTTVTGTTPTMDVQVVESFDAGATYTRVMYQFPRVTAAIAQPLFSPPIVMSGSKIEVIQTITGTTPSFTRALFMNQVNRTVTQAVLQIFDRTVTLTTLASTTATLYSNDTGTNVQMDINVGAVTTTAPALQLQVSNDGANSWISIGSPLTAVASSTVTATVTGTSAQLVRAIVTTAGSGVTAGYVLLRTF